MGIQEHAEIMADMMNCDNASNSGRSADSLKRKWSNQDYINLINDLKARTDSDKGALIMELWPVWRHTDQIVIARTALEACFADLKWTDEPESNHIATRIVSTINAFPEFELEFSVNDLAEKVLAFQSASSHHATLAYSLNPSLMTAVERLLFEAIRDFDLLAMSRLVPEYIAHFHSDLAVSKVLAEFGRIQRQPPMVVLNSLADVVKCNSSLSALMLRKSLEAVLVETASAETSLSQITKITQRVRQVVCENRRPFTKEIKPAITEQDIDRVVQVMKRLSALVRFRTNSALASNNFRRSGVVRWTDLALDLGFLHISPKEFRTNYADVDADGCLHSASHTGSGTFQYGPYSELAEGAYAVDFLGEMRDQAEARFRVTAQSGTVELAATTSKAVELSQENPILASLTFVLNNRAYCEFVIESNISTGFIRSNGVRLLLLNEQVDHADSRQ